MREKQCQQARFGIAMAPAEVRRVRELYGMTQGEFAALLGLTGTNRDGTVRKYENGRVKVWGGRKAQIEALRAKKEKRR